jgi:hypothetical protein
MQSLPLSDAAFAAQLGYAHQHIQVIRQYYKRPLDRSTFYEFGAGWDLIVPLALYSFGVDKQIVVDVRSLLKASLVNDAIHKFQGLASTKGMV